eukprot:TRINITY_DN8205_c0_g1_i1.p1 TRINITY_DN8205_c0_g1~~TRINITY_DN8205_c0_g1_i1.p1  ORF type:complete len:455 (-),score=135.81 TRINITY_DN8205_c0_g1_i1:166-1530(-)
MLNIQIRGGTLLHFAVISQTATAVRDLLIKGIDTTLSFSINNQFNGKTALEIAKMKSYTFVLKVFEDFKANQQKEIKPPDVKNVQQTEIKQPQEGQKTQITDKSNIKQDSKQDVSKTPVKETSNIKQDLKQDFSKTQNNELSPVEISWKFDDDILEFQLDGELYNLEKTDTLANLPVGLTVERDGKILNNTTKISIALRKGSKLLYSPPKQTKPPPIAAPTIGPSNKDFKRSRNRFGDGLNEFTAMKVTFYDSNFQPSETIQQTIQNLLGNSMAMLVSNLNLPSKTLKPEQVALIYIYTLESPFYPALNAAMRSGKEEDWKIYQNFIYHCCTALNMLPPFQGHLYRGIDCQLEDYQVGKVVVWRAFSSSTKNIEVSIQFLKQKKGTLFLINSSTSREIQQFSAMQSEDEVLFLPNTCFKITHQIEGAAKSAMLKLIPQGALELKDIIIFELTEI